MTVGELIRYLSHYCPDTNVSVFGPTGESYIESIVSDEEEQTLVAEIAFVISEG